MRSSEGAASRTVTAKGRAAVLVRAAAAAGVQVGDGARGDREGPLWLVAAGRVRTRSSVSSSSSCAAMCSAERISAAANAAAVVSSARSRSRRSCGTMLAGGGYGAVVFAHDVGDQFVDVIAADDVFGAASGERRGRQALRATRAGIVRRARSRAIPRCASAGRVLRR